MNTPYVSAAFAFFAIVMAWDYIAPRIKLVRVRRAIVARTRRESEKKSQ